MKFGEELKAAAIVGTAQKEPDFDALGGGLGETLAKVDRAEKEKFLLSAAAVYMIWKSAGKNLKPDAQNAPETSEYETREILRGRLKQIFETLLQSNEKAEFLPEFLLLMNRRGKIIPPELLPVVLSSDYQASKFRGFNWRHLFLPVIGNRGGWLAKKRDDWRWALVEKNGEELWETGKLNERIFALEFFRQQNPTLAREMLQTVWNSESAKERQKFLEVLRINLSCADEKFLDEVFRADKSGEVKRTAFELLANLPDSKLSEEITELIRPIISVKKKLMVKREIEIELPADWKEQAANLKTVGKQAFWKAKILGDKALALALGLSVVNPQIWEESLNLNAEEIAALAYKNEWSPALLAGFGMASMRYENERWFSAVLKVSSKSDLAASPFFVWSVDSFDLIPEQKTFPLMVAHPDYVFTDWFLDNVKFQSIETARFIEQKNLPPGKFTNVERNYGWRKLAFILSFRLIDKWISELETMKSRSGYNEYQKNIFDGVIENLKFRKEYILEFEK